MWCEQITGFVEWITEGKGELTVVLDAKSQALKWQDIIVSEKDKVFYFMKMGGNTVISSHAEFTVFFICKL